MSLLICFGLFVGAVANSQESTPSIQQAFAPPSLSTILRGKVVDVGAEFILGDGFDSKTWEPVYVGGKRTFSGKLSVDGIAFKRWIFVRNQSLEFMFPLSDWLSSKNKNVTTLVFGGQMQQMLPFERMTPQEQGVVEDFCAQGLQIYGLPKAMSVTEFRESQPHLFRELVPVCGLGAPVSVQAPGPSIGSTGPSASPAVSSLQASGQELIDVPVTLDVWMTGLAASNNGLVKRAGRSNLTNYGVRPNGQRYAGYFVGGVPLQTWLNTYGSAHGTGPYGADWKLALYKGLYPSYDALSPDQRALLRYFCGQGLSVYDSSDSNYGSSVSACGRSDEVSSDKNNTNTVPPTITSALSLAVRMTAAAVDTVSGARFTIALVYDASQGVSPDAFAVVVGSQKLNLKDWYAKYGVNSDGHVKYGIVLLPLERATSYDSLGLAERTLVWNFCWAGLNIYEHTAMDPRTSQFPLPGRVSACRLLPRVPAPNSEPEQQQLRLQYDALQGREFNERGLPKRPTHQKPVFVPALEVYEATGAGPDLTRPTGKIMTDAVLLVGDTDGQNNYFGIFAEGPNSLNPRGQWNSVADWLRFNGKFKFIVLFRTGESRNYENLPSDQKAVIQGFCRDGLLIYETVDTRQRMPGSFRSSEMNSVCGR